MKSFARYKGRILTRQPNLHFYSRGVLDEYQNQKSSALEAGQPDKAAEWELRHSQLLKLRVSVDWRADPSITVEQIILKDKAEAELFDPSQMADWHLAHHTRLVDKCRCTPVPSAVLAASSPSSGATHPVHAAHAALVAFLSTTTVPDMAMHVLQKAVPFP